MRVIDLVGCSAEPARPTPLIQCFHRETSSRGLRRKFSEQAAKWRDSPASSPYLALKDGCF
jgi:hypothetical protein